MFARYHSSVQNDPRSSEARLFNQESINEFCTNLEKDKMIFLKDFVEDQKVKIKKSDCNSNQMMRRQYPMNAEEAIYLKLNMSLKTIELIVSRQNKLKQILQTTVDR